MTFDGGGHVLDGRAESHTTGVAVEHGSATVPNATIADNLVCVSALGATDLTLADNDRAPDRPSAA
ncbi:hypothetical protein [Halorussus marinus]|uniref:hypothetical protein n=1 Tax=Halorussus marinus TaxID=2505976 RepID=UPI00106EC150|nr:hypothetical protein [Halorussus marinus]